MTTDFDPLAMDDPFEFYRRARREMPIFFDARSNYWVITKHSDVRSILADEERFSAEAGGESYAGLHHDAVAIL